MSVDMDEYDRIVNKFKGRVSWPEALTMVGKGWWPLVERLADDLLEMGWDGGLSQVKEKFGGLRFYTQAINQDMHKRISKAEVESLRTCELCGKPGSLIDDTGWIMVRCNMCFGPEDDPED